MSLVGLTLSVDFTGDLKESFLIGRAGGFRSMLVFEVEPSSCSSSIFE